MCAQYFVNFANRIFAAIFTIVAVVLQMKIDFVVFSIFHLVYCSALMPIEESSCNDIDCVFCVQGMQDVAKDNAATTHSDGESSEPVK